MSDTKNKPEDAAKHKQHEHAKHHKGGEIDGIGGAGGSSGAGSVEATPDYIGEISGIDADLDTDEIPMPGSTGKAGPDNARAGHREGGMTGKARGNSTDSEPSRSSGNG